MAITVPFHIRRDTDENIRANKGKLLPGELAYATDTRRLYMKEYESNDLFEFADADATLASIETLTAAVADNAESLEEAQEALQEALDGNEAKLQTIIDRGVEALEEENEKMEIRVTRALGTKVSLPDTFGRRGQIAKSDANGGIIWEDGVPVDATLSEEGAAADSKAVGDRINQLILDYTAKHNDQEEAIATLQSEALGYVNGYNLSDDYYLTLLHDGEPIGGNPIPVGGGGGGGGGGGDVVIISDMTFENKSGFLTKSIAKDGECKATINWTSTVDGIPTGDGSMRIYVNSGSRAPVGVAQGDVTIDLAKLCTATTNKIRVVIEDAYGKTASIIYTITIVNASLTTAFNQLVAHGSTVSIPVTATAEAEKTMYYILDGGPAVTEVITTSGIQTVKTFEGLAHGVHSLEMYFECEIDMATIESRAASSSRHTPRATSPTTLLPWKPACRSSSMTSSSRTSRWTAISTALLTSSAIPGPR